MPTPPESAGTLDSSVASTVTSPAALISVAAPSTMASASIMMPLTATEAPTATAVQQVVLLGRDRRDRHVAAGTKSSSFGAALDWNQITVDIRARVDGGAIVTSPGFIAQVLVAPGAEVSGGEVLFRLEDPVLMARGALLRVQRAEIATRLSQQVITDRTATEDSGQIIFSDPRTQHLMLHPRFDPSRKRDAPH